MATLKSIQAIVKRTYDDGTEHELTYVGEHGDACIEIGFDMHQNGRIVEKEPNGERRICIKLWNGMSAFEDFKPVGKEVP